MTFLIYSTIYIILYIISAKIFWDDVIEYRYPYPENIYPTYPHTKPNFWDYLKIFNPLNVLFLFGLIIWIFIRIVFEPYNRRERLRNLKKINKK